VLATAVGGPAEIVTDGRDGRLLAPREPETWARAAAELLDDPGARAAMAARGRERAADFDAGAYARPLLDLYATLVAGRAR
jgi:glycosyltransferase involved in cell wall biosynthesis